MKKFRICYQNENGVGKEITLEAPSVDRGLGDALMDYADNEYDVDSQTDGTDVWYEDENGEQITVMHITSITEVNEILEAREKAGLSRRKTAMLLGIPCSTLQSWEEGKGNPKTDPQWYIDRIRALGCLTSDGIDSILSGQNTVDDALAWHKNAEAKKSSKWGDCGDTYRKNRERIPDDIANALTAEQLGRLVDVIKTAYDAGKGGDMEIRRLDEMPFDKVFSVNGNEELCHATGYEVFKNGQWWNEYEDSEGELHYGR